MAITATASTCSTKPLEKNTQWFVNAYSADASGCEEIKAAPAAGTSLVITSLSVICAVKDITVTIGAGDTGGAVTTVIWGPLPFVAEVTAAGYIFGVQYTCKFDTPIVLAAATSLTVDASGAGAVIVMAQGYII